MSAVRLKIRADEVQWGDEVVGGCGEGTRYGVVDDPNCWTKWPSKYRYIGFDHGGGIAVEPSRLLEVIREFGAP